MEDEKTSEDDQTTDDVEVERRNCWEFMQCGRETGGGKAAELGVCPAVVERRANRINGGTNGGRVCWALTGTMCGGRVQGTFAVKYGNCQLCPFFKKVMDELGFGVEGMKAALDSIDSDSRNRAAPGRI